MAPKSFYIVANWRYNAQAGDYYSAFAHGLDFRNLKSE